MTRIEVLNRLQELQAIALGAGFSRFSVEIYGDRLDFSMRYRSDDDALDGYLKFDEFGELVKNITFECLELIVEKYAKYAEGVKVEENQDNE